MGPGRARGETGLSGRRSRFPGWGAVAEAGSAVFDARHGVKDGLDAGAALRLIVLWLVEFTNDDMKFFLTDAQGAGPLVGFKSTQAVDGANWK